MKVLSLYDGMACGILALIKAEIEIESYDAFEIDKYAIQTANHNFPMIRQHGDVFSADFTQFKGVDLLCGGSPCTYWSIAQKNNRETEASGMGWELFCQYVRAVKEAEPKFFVYENNKSMSKAIRESIDKAFGFEAVLINSALVSAQNRQRLYWVGKRNDDGTYSKVDIEQPEDKGILLKDILETGEDLTSNEKGYTLVASYNGAVAWNTIERSQRNMVAEPVNVTVEQKAHCIKAVYYKQGMANFVTNGGHLASAVAEPVRIGTIESDLKNQSHDSKQYRVYSPDGKSTTLCGQGGGMGAKTGLYAIQCCPMKVKEATKRGYLEVEIGEAVDMTQPNSKTRRGRNMSLKSNCIMTSCQYYQYCGVLGYATACEWDDFGNPIKAISVADGKIYDVYAVKDGQITIKGKNYPIKLVEGYYIIRKLTVKECMRLQTVPEWYEFPVSNSQAYKMLGNGWTVDVIAHIFKHLN